MGDIIIIACDNNQDPKTITFGNPTVGFITIPQQDYERLRMLVGLPDMICPES